MSVCSKASPKRGIPRVVAARVGGCDAKRTQKSEAFRELFPMDSCSLRLGNRYLRGSSDEARIHKRSHHASSRRAKKCQNKPKKLNESQPNPFVDRSHLGMALR